MNINTKINEFIGDYEFLSNFHPSEINVNGNTYRTVEHAFQAQKTLNKQQHDAIRDCKYPGQSKRLGRRCTLRADWEEVKDSIMYEACMAKFVREPFKSLLLNTEDKEIIEGNWWNDTYWGIDLETMVGDNHLGKILMQIRDELKG